MQVLDALLDQFFGGKKQPGNPPAADDGGKPAQNETAAGVASVINSAGQNQGGIGGTVGEAAGSVVGSLFGPAGSTIGAALGGQLGGVVEKAGAVPAGPGQTIESGHVDTSQRSPLGDMAASMGQSLQQMAMKGLTNRAAANGRGKTF